MNRRDESAERASGTVLALALCSTLATLLVAGALLAGALVATHRARSAADLAALAGAARLGAGADPATACALAEGVAADNGARAGGCRAFGAEVRIEATVALPRALGRIGLGPARAQARAGPPGTVPPPVGPDGR